MFLLHKLRLRAKAESLDSVTRPKTVVTEREIYDYLSQENGMIRLRRAFDIRNGEMSPELQFYFNNYASGDSAKVILFISSLYSINKNIKLLPPNMPKNERFKRLFITSIKETVMISIKYMSIIVLSFGITETIAIYRNKTSPLEFCLVGGLMSGIINGLKYDPKPSDESKLRAKQYNLTLKPLSRLVAMRNSAIAGSVLGLLMGFVFTYLAERNGMSQEKRHFWNVQAKLQEKKEKVFEEWNHGNERDNKLL